MKCILRPWSLSDAPELVKIIGNKRVQDNLRDGIPYPYTEENAREFIALATEDRFARAIIVEGYLAGSISAMIGDNIHSKTAELGYYLGEEYWSRGIMTDAIRQMCDYIFATGEIIRIYAEPFAHNLGSCRALEKAGFVYEGTLRSNGVKNGTVIDMKMYSRLISDK